MQRRALLTQQNGDEGPPGDLTLGFPSVPVCLKPLWGDAGNILQWRCEYVLTKCMLELHFTTGALFLPAGNVSPSALRSEVANVLITWVMHFCELIRAFDHLSKVQFRCRRFIKGPSGSIVGRGILPVALTRPLESQQSQSVVYVRGSFCAAGAVSLPMFVEGWWSHTKTRFSHACWR